MATYHTTDVEALARLLPNQDSYNVTDAKAILRELSPEFEALSARNANKITRRVLRVMEQQGKIWVRPPNYDTSALDVSSVTSAVVPTTGSAGGNSVPPATTRLVFNKQSLDLHPTIRSEFNYLLHRFYAHSDSTWVIDTEFYSTAANINPIAFTIAIRTLNGREILNTTVNYNCFIQQLMTTISPYLHRNGMPTSEMMKRPQRAAILHYKRGNTHGMTMTQIREHLLQQGWDYRTHNIISWFSSFDLQIFSRVMADIGDGAISQRYQGKQVCDAARICQKVVPQGQTVALAELHKLVYPEKLICNHDADQDVLAMIDIIKALAADLDQ